MLSFIAGFALIQTQTDQTPRLRTLLDNGAVVLVEPIRAPTISVQLFASARYVPETSASHGYRHLLEHLIVRGSDGSLDRKLESQACFLKARTFRDAMQIELTVGPNQLKLALDTLGGILRNPEITQESIDRELRVMRDELGLQDDASLLSSAAWSAAYGEGGLDPLGTFDSMYRATPEKLADVFDRQFASEGLALVIAGPVDLDVATKLGVALLGPKAKGHWTEEGPARKPSPGRTDAEGFGEARGAMVPGFDSPQTAAALAAGLAIASEFPSSFLIYTPTSRAGLVLVGRSDSNSGVGLFVDSLTPDGPLFETGKMLAREWVMRQLRTPSGIGFLRGILLCYGAGNRPETLLKAIDDMTQKQFDEGVKAFATERAVIAVGSR